MKIKEIKYCNTCEKQISEISPTGLCASCVKKGELNPNYKDGLKSKPNFCQDCGIKISATHTPKLPKRCKSCANSGENHPNFGKFASKETRKKMSESHKGQNNSMWGKRGQLHPNYIEGLIRKYPLAFNTELKETIRKKYSYICQLCLESGKCVHHIDYDKENCKEDNLTLLCRGCNVKVNYGDRNMWQQYFILKRRKQ